MEDINPKEIAVVKSQVTKAISAATAVVVNSDESMLEAGEIRKKIKIVGKMIKDKKEAITKPINEALKNVRAMFAPLEDDCETAEKIIARKMMAYQSEQEAKRLKAEREAQEKLDKAAKELEAGKITEAQADKVIAKVETKLEKAPEVIRKSKDFHTRTVKKFRVVNPTLVPRAYLAIDEVAIRKAMMSDIPVEGVEYYEEKVMV